MKIGLIRHFPVQHPFLKGLVSQGQVLEWFQEYDKAAVLPMPVALDNSWQRCYTSQLPRARQTAEAIFNGEIISTELLNEPFPDPIFSPNFKLPFLVWGVLIRLALLHNHASQAHRKEVLQQRLRGWLTELLARPDTQVLIVSHVFILEILSRLLRDAGFSGPILNQPKNGILYTYERPDFHT